MLNVEVDDWYSPVVPSNVSVGWWEKKNRWLCWCDLTLCLKVEQHLNELKSFSASSPQPFSSPRNRAHGLFYMSAGPAVTNRHGGFPCGQRGRFDSRLPQQQPGDAVLCARLQKVRRGPQCWIHQPVSGYSGSFLSTVFKPSFHFRCLGGGPTGTETRTINPIQTSSNTHIWSVGEGKEKDKRKQLLETGL